MCVIVALVLHSFLKNNDDIINSLPKFAQARKLDEAQGSGCVDIK